jgi:hypothetical protein
MIWYVAEIAQYAYLMLELAKQQTLLSSFVISTPRLINDIQKYNKTEGLQKQLAGLYSEKLHTT